MKDINPSFLTIHRIIDKLSFSYFHPTLEFSHYQPKPRFPNSEAVAARARLLPDASHPLGWPGPRSSRCRGRPAARGRFLRWVARPCCTPTHDKLFDYICL